MVTQWANTVFLCATLPFQALLLQRRMGETSVTEGLEPCKSSPPSHILRQEDRTLWDSVCSSADLTKFISTVIISAASFFTCKQGFLHFSVIFAFVRINVCCLCRKSWTSCLFRRQPLEVLNGVKLYSCINSYSVHWIILNL